MNHADVQRMREKLGITDAPLVNQGIETTLAFFRDDLRADPFEWFDYIRGIDFHKSIAVEYLAADTKLSRHRSTGSARPKPFVYFTKPGTSPFSTGTSFAESEYELFRTAGVVKVLVSSASGIKFSPTDQVSRLGGGVQYIMSQLDANRLIRAN